jgi:hypothetical protein
MKKLKQSAFSRLDGGERSASKSGSFTAVEGVSYTNRRGSWMDLRLSHIMVVNIPHN